MQQFPRGKAFCPTELVPPDFTFCIDGKKYPVHRVAVGSLSPSMNREFLNDPNFSSYTFTKLKDPNNYFQLISNLFHGHKITITLQNAPFLNEIATILELEYLQKATLNYIVQPTPENAIEIMKYYGESNIDNSACAKILANDFDTYSQNPEFFKLPICAFEQIFSDESFDISDNELFDFIEKLIQQNSKSYASLLSFVHTESIDQERANKLADQVAYDNVSVEIIDSMLYRINPARSNGPSN
ncbi:hypothetical protein TVAG_127240 [Trichomonas vaginalis G3]|uniref:BTB domain-containing protein n=1 Tax=Trichomonas vaginalis (strain ATCC PRA-98 / G3) TaxID=412133 RepID=A2E7Z1_TRIV3|nr:POZ domain family [Trichomonas vaginalis G3]EAY11217.1 hypothetical protein TVAG_127240 [Trichomonas vaginalis G3]KAI5551403.1 POZ domain family [Trichomonas vaginalis G3]|eukprot:XP_001323440.1 hypothetical protein [Trichomonas vaginalis G3]